MNRDRELQRTSSAWTMKDGVWSLALALAALLLYVATPQVRLTIDGAGLAGKALLGTGEDYYNILYLPAVRSAAALIPGPSDLGEIRTASSLFAALGVGCTYLIVRRFGASLPAALLATGLWALSPGLWFFATTIETHAVHAGVAGIATLVFLWLPWRRAVLALVAAALLMPLYFWTQQVSILLGPGLVLLADLARRRVAPGFPPLKLLFVVGPILLAGFMAALIGANLFRFGQVSPTVEGQVAQILFDKGPKPTWWTEWLAPLGLIAPLALTGLLPGRDGLPSLHTRATLVLLILPAAVFFSWWGVHERGGYFLGSACFHVALAAFALDRFLSTPKGQAPDRQRHSRQRRTMVLVLVPLLFAAQVWMGNRPRRAYDVGWDPVDRTEQARVAVGERGFLLATSNISPPLALFLPDVEEFLLWEASKQILMMSDGQADPAEQVPWVLRRIDRELAKGRAVAFETGYRETDPAGSARSYADALDEVLDAVRSRYETRTVPHPHWPMEVIVKELTQ